MKKQEKSGKFFYAFYKKPFLSAVKKEELKEKIRNFVFGVKDIETEKVYYAESTKKLTNSGLRKLRWLFGDKHGLQNLSETSFLRGNVIEVGPRLNMETAESTNAVSICAACGIKGITRIEQARRYKVIKPGRLSKKDVSLILPLIHEKMVECQYEKPLQSFAAVKEPDPVRYIPVMAEGLEALKRANKEYGTGMDDADLNYYLHLVRTVLKRDLTDVEFCDLGNCNSEHSRHHIFRAKIVIDGREMPFTLFELIKSTLTNPENSKIAFHDNSSVIRGYKVSALMPSIPGMPSRERMAQLLYNFVLTCETHNHPSLVEPYQGSATGRDGRERDNKGVGRGGVVCAGSAGFVGGNLNIPGYKLPWEDPLFAYDPNVASPLEFFIKATNGAFDNANEAGEPLVDMFIESFGFMIGDERWESVKPIMFSGGFGFIRDCHVKKRKPQKGWLVVKIGGPAYRIGFGGGAASSQMKGENEEKLDFNSVQRADGEMSQKVNRVIRACIDLGLRNPIESIHDQGAGGNGNVLKEIVDPVGGVFILRRIPVGDRTMSPVEVWVCEYQDNMAMLIKPENQNKFQAICEREKVPFAVVGTITGDGKAVLIDDKSGTTLVDLKLKDVLGDYPQKTFRDGRKKLPLESFSPPEDLTVMGAANLVFRLLGVCSKEWANGKVDNSVTGKVVQALPVGPLGLPISNYSVIAPSYFDNVGEANSIGQRPAIGLISPQAMARMTAAEALLRLIGVPVSSRKEIKASANWMLAAKLPGGIAWLYDAASALTDFLKIIGINIDGGKDSLSLATKIKKVLKNGKGKEEIVQSLRTLVISTYAACPDFRFRITPDIKTPGRSRLMFVDLANGKTRLGGSALTQCLKNVGTECPDADNPEMIIKAFDLVQKMLSEKLLLSVHNKDRGGLLATLSEMAFAGNCGFNVAFDNPRASSVEMLLNEELGFVFEYLPENERLIVSEFKKAGLGGIVHRIGHTIRKRFLTIYHNEHTALSEDMRVLRALWRETSYQMDALQTTKECVESRRAADFNRNNPAYQISFNPDRHKATKSLRRKYMPDIAVIREEGTNSDEEARAACVLAGMRPHDIMMSDIVDCKISLKNFRGAIFAGGFSYKDVLGSAKGFAGAIKFNSRAASEFSSFFSRPDTFSLGICNGAQLGGLLDLFLKGVPEKLQPAFIRNTSERFESGFRSVRIFPSPSIMLKGMEDSILGVHVAHGEGRFFTPDRMVLEKIINLNLAPIRFVDDGGNPTEKYPFNPNGSMKGITAICDPSGRHLAFMEHPERTVLRRQWPYWPDEWDRLNNSPWLRMFQNARNWCEETRQKKEV